MPKPFKTIGKTKVFQWFLEAGRPRKHAKMAPWRFGCDFEGHLAGHGRHLLANKAAKSQHDPFLGPSWAHLGPILEHVGAKVGLRWVFLGASWAVWRHFGALREAPGRHLEAKVGFGSIGLELTCAKKASCQNL